MSFSAPTPGVSALLFSSLLAPVVTAETFLDGEFPDASWQAELLVGELGDATHESQQATTGGHPGSFRRTRHLIDEGGIVGAHFPDGWVFDPSAQGSIQHVDFSFDLLQTGGASPVEHRLLLEQDGVLFTSDEGRDASVTWESHSITDQLAGDFSPQGLYRTSGLVAPDFSSAGAPIRVGYRTSVLVDDPGSYDAGIDNLVVSLAIVGGPFVFDDGTFDDSAWMSEKIADTSGLAFETTRYTSGGAPGSFRSVTHQLLVGDLVVGHFREGWTYDPGTQGAIEDLAFSYDLRRVSGATGVRYRLILEQDGVLYESISGDIIDTDGWQHFSHVGEREHRFTLQDGDRSGTARGTNPDFSEEGAPIRFGYRSSNSADHGAAFLLESGIDNFTVVINAVVAVGDGHGAAVPFLRVHPNPGSAPFSMTYSLTPVGESRLDVYDVAGRRVWHQPLGAAEGAARWPGLRSSGAPAPPGLYFVEVSNGAVRVRQRVALLR